MRRVYASLPLTGPSGRWGRSVLRGVDLALEQHAERAGVDPVDLVALDSAGDDRDGQAVTNARRAADDERAAAYVGDFHSSQVQQSAPVLSAAGVLQVAPVATFTGLQGATLVRLMPNDAACAGAVAEWLEAIGVRRLLVVHDHDESYGGPVGRLCVDAARSRGVDVRALPVWDDNDDAAADVGDAQATLYVGVAGSGAVGLWHALHAANPDMWLLGSDGVATAWLAAELPAPVAARTRFFTARRAPWAFYGHQAMSLVLDCVDAGDRADVVRAARSGVARRSVLGDYTIDDDGLTTSHAYGRLVVFDGAMAWDRE
jgi:ABC-type branched-subunit amino acid transport system substrate-binding protein